MCERLTVQLRVAEVAAGKFGALLGYAQENLREERCPLRHFLFTDSQTSLLKTAGEIPGLWMGYPIGRGGISVGIAWDIPRDIPRDQAWDLGPKSFRLWDRAKKGL
jgi:hypothetical protein